MALALSKLGKHSWAAEAALAAEEGDYLHPPSKPHGSEGMAALTALVQLHSAEANLMSQVVVEVRTRAGQLHRHR